MKITVSNSTNTTIKDNKVNSENKNENVQGNKNENNGAGTQWNVRDMITTKYSFIMISIAATIVALTFKPNLSFLGGGVSSIFKSVVQSVKSLKKIF